MTIALLAATLGVLLGVRLLLSRREATYTLLERVMLPWGPACVRETSEVRELVFEKTGLVQTRTSRESLQSRLHYTKIFHLAAALVPRTGSALFIGAGGGVVPREFEHDYDFRRIDVVELSGQVLDLARRHFGLRDGGRLRLHLGDGADFLKQAPERFQLIVVDAFQNEDTPPRALWAPAALRRIRECLAVSGVACLNICGRPRGRVVRELGRSLQAIFGPGRVVRCDVRGPAARGWGSWSRTNLVFIAARDRELITVNWQDLSGYVPVCYRQVVCARGEDLTLTYAA
jgi:spermidine synthase